MRRSNFALRQQPSLLKELRKAAEAEGVALNQLINDEAARSSVVMRAELATDAHKRMGVRVQLQQVFMNLMLNAIEAMKNLGGELTLKSRLEDGQLLFSVSDTGPGL